MVKQYKDKKILITGGLGFMGINLAHRLSKYKARVTLLTDVLWPGHKRDLRGIMDKIKIRIGDIRNQKQMDEIVRDQEIIFNLAGKSGASESVKNPFIDLDVNCKGHLTILEACRKYNPNIHIVFPSSRLVYGKEKYLPVDESHPLNPSSIYGIHKLTGENYHLLYNKLYGTKVTILRISNPYGCYQRISQKNYGIVNWFIHLALEKKEIPIFGEGLQKRDYIYIEDLVDAFLMAAVHKKTAGEIFNLGSDKGIRFIDMAKIIVKKAGRGSIKHVNWPYQYKEVETGDYITDISKICRVINWRPQTNFDSGISKVIDFYKSQIVE